MKETEFSKIDLDALQWTYQLYVFLEVKRIVYKALKESKFLEEKNDNLTND